MIRVEHQGDFGGLTKWLNNIKFKKVESVLKKYGERGVQALMSATPKDTGKTAASWYYMIENEKDGSTSISFHNSNVIDHVKIAIILQHGHATRDGGWVQGKDYINPALRPVFDEIANAAWKEVTKI